MLLAFGPAGLLPGAGTTRVEAASFGSGYEVVLTPTGPDTNPSTDEWWAMDTQLEWMLEARGADNVTVESFRDDGLFRVRFQAGKGGKTAVALAEAVIADLNDPAEFTIRDSDGNVQMDGRDLEECYASANAGEVVVILVFTPAGSAKFADVTGDSIGEQLSIYVDDRLLLSPKVDARVEGSDIVIDGMKDQQEADDVVGRIRTCLLPFPVAVVSQGSIQVMAVRTLLDAIGENHAWPLVIGLLVVVVIGAGFLLRMGANRKRRRR
jgi:hypothetical protein